MACGRGSMLVLFLACCLLLTISNISEARSLHAEGHGAGTLVEQQRPSSAWPLGFLSQGNVKQHEDTPSLALYEQETSKKAVMIPHENIPLLLGSLDEDSPIPESELRYFGEDIPILEPDLSSILQDHDLLSSIPTLLNQSGLPIGLLPSSVASYAITTYGDFIVSLQEPCYVDFDYEVYYAQTITGKLSYGTITNLSGIQAKEAFFWVPITAIRTDIPSSGFIYFNVGPISKKLPISEFETIPTCKAKSMAL